MIIQVLLAIPYEENKDLRTIFLSIGLASDALVYVFHSDVPREETFDFNGCPIAVIYGQAKNKLAAYNALLKRVTADAFVFVEPTEQLMQCYATIIEDSFVVRPKADVILFGQDVDCPNVRFRATNAYSLSNLCIKKRLIGRLPLSFLCADYSYFFDGSAYAFICSCLSRDVQCAARSKTLLYRQEPLTPDIPNLAFFCSFRYNSFWALATLLYALSRRQNSTLQAKPSIVQAINGHFAFVKSAFSVENEPIRSHILAFVISIIALVGFVTQLALSLLIAFTDVQYVPIWVSLGFMVLFAIIYNRALSKTHNANAVLVSCVSISTLATIASYVLFALLGVVWGMSLYGAFIVFISVTSMVFSFWPWGTETRRAP